MRRIGSKTKALLVVAAVPLAVCGCMSMGLLNPGLNRTEPKIEGSTFEPDIRVIGLERSIPGTFLSSYFIRSWVDRKTGVARHQLYVSHYYSGEWIFWNRANTQEAEPLEFTQISRDVGSCSGSRFGGCSFTEVFGVSLPDSLLRSHPSGYTIKFYAKTGRDMLISIDSDQIAKQLASINRVRTSLAPGGSQTAVAPGATVEAAAPARSRPIAPASRSSTSPADKASEGAVPAEPSGLRAQAAIGAPLSEADRRAGQVAFAEAQAFIGSHEWEKAEQTFQKALLYDGSVAKYHAALGSLMMLLHRWVDAQASYSAAVLLEVDNPEYRRRLKEARARR